MPDSVYGRIERLCPQCRGHVRVEDGVPADGVNLLHTLGDECLLVDGALGLRRATPARVPLIQPSTRRPRSTIVNWARRRGPVFPTATSDDSGDCSKIAAASTTHAVTTARLAGGGPVQFDGLDHEGINRVGVSGVVLTGASSNCWMWASICCRAGPPAT